MMRFRGWHFFLLMTFVLILAANGFASPRGGKGGGGGRGGQGSGGGIFLVALLVIAWLVTGFYRVDEAERQIIAEYYQRVFGEDLPESVAHRA